MLLLETYFARLKVNISSKRKYFYSISVSLLMWYFIFLIFLRDDKPIADISDFDLHQYLENSDHH